MLLIRLRQSRPAAPILSRKVYLYVELNREDVTFLSPAAVLKGCSLYSTVFE
jgi:hypothetical protein